MTSAPDVSFENVTKTFGDTRALDDISFEVKKGEFFCIIGPSGCGKTTALRALAGLIQSDSGVVRIKGEDMTGIATHRRPISMVFQTWALFPHMTVYDNVAFGLRMRKTPDDELKKKVTEALGLVRLTGLENRMPRELSGGQMQRVGVARAIVLRPEVLLLDEPLGNLDFKLQAQMEIELKLIHRQLGITFVYVTHNQAQAMALGDRIMVMNLGKIEQLAPPSEIYNSPNSVFVAKFVGDSNIMKGNVVGAPRGFVSMETDFGTYDVPYAGEGKGLLGQTLAFIVRPERVKTGEERAKYHVEGQVLSKVYRGNEIMYLVDVGGTELKARKQVGEAFYNPGISEKIKMGWNSEDMVLLERISVVKGMDLDRVILGA